MKHLKHFIVVVVLVLSYSQIAAMEYRVIEITAPDPEASVYVTGLNHYGQVVGQVYWSAPSGTDGVVFIWQNGQMTVLPNPNGMPPRLYSGPLINNNGDVVAQYTTDPLVSSFTGLWRNGAWTEIPTLGGLMSIPWDLNDNGVVVGNSFLPEVPNQVYHHGFAWRDGIMTDLPTLGLDLAFAKNVSNNGDIAGLAYSLSSLPNAHLVLWRNGQILDLGRGFPEDMNNAGHLVGQYVPLGGTQALDALWINGQRTMLGQLFNGPASEPKFINDLDHVTGWQRESITETEFRDHVYFWEDGTMVDIGNLGGGGDVSVRGMNNRDQIVGSSYVVDFGDRPYLWQDGLMTDLSIMTNQNFDGCGPSAINDAGQILINCGSSRAYLLDPFTTTSQGSNVQVDLGGSVSMTFASITAEGETRIIVNPTPPTTVGGFQINGIYYDLFTNATYSGPIQITLPYDPVRQPDPLLLRMFHYEPALGSWVDVTTNVDMASHTVSGVVTSLSWFGVGIPTRSFSGFLPPINPDGTSVFKLGRTIPVKFRLTDANGNAVTNAVVRLYLSKINNGTIGTEVNADSNSNADSGNIFRYSQEDGCYIFNLGTKTLSQGTWRLRAASDNGISYIVNFALKSK